MFDIDYIMHDDDTIDFSKADTKALRYNLFLGNLILRANYKSILIDWEWIPLLDFALCISAITKILKKESSGIQEFEFTESNAKLIFSKDFDKLLITTSFCDTILELRFINFYNAVDKFNENIITEIGNRHQQIHNNPNYTNFLKEINNM